MYNFWIGISFKQWSQYYYRWYFRQYLLADEPNLYVERANYILQSQSYFQYYHYYYYFFTFYPLSIQWLLFVLFVKYILHDQIPYIPSSFNQQTYVLDIFHMSLNLSIQSNVMRQIALSFQPLCLQSSSIYATRLEHCHPQFFNLLVVLKALSQYNSIVFVRFPEWTLLPYIVFNQNRLVTKEK